MRCRKCYTRQERAMKKHGGRKPQTRRRHRFPEPRTDTITRANVALLLMSWSGERRLEPQDVARVLLGRGADVTARHIDRAASLMPQGGQG